MEDKGKNSEPVFAGAYGNVVRWVVLILVVIMIIGILGFYLSNL